MNLWSHILFSSFETHFTRAFGDRDDIWTQDVFEKLEAEILEA